MTSKRKSDTVKPAATVENKARNLIEEQMAAFLKSGGQVQQIPNGTSGQINSPVARRQISLGKKPAPQK